MYPSAYPFLKRRAKHYAKQASAAQVVEASDRPDPGEDANGAHPLRAEEMPVGGTTGEDYRIRQPSFVGSRDAVSRSDNVSDENGVSHSGVVRREVAQPTSTGGDGDTVRQPEVSKGESPQQSLPSWMTSSRPDEARKVHGQGVNAADHAGNDTRARDGDYGRHDADSSKTDASNLFTGGAAPTDGIAPVVPNIASFRRSGRSAEAASHDGGTGEGIAGAVETGRVANQQNDGAVFVNPREALGQEGEGGGDTWGGKGIDFQRRLTFGHVRGEQEGHNVSGSFGFHGA